jgi:hypothetical protein
MEIIKNRTIEDFKLSNEHNDDIQEIVAQSETKNLILKKKKDGQLVPELKLTNSAELMKAIMTCKGYYRQAKKSIKQKLSKFFDLVMNEIYDKDVADKARAKISLKKKWKRRRMMTLMMRMLMMDKKRKKREKKMRKAILMTMKIMSLIQS